MRQDHLKEAASFPSDDGCHDPSSPIPTLDPPGCFAKPPPPGILQGFALAQDSPLGLTFLHGHGKARPQRSKTRSPSALSRFLNRFSRLPRPGSCLWWRRRRFTLEGFFPEMKGGRELVGGQGAGNSGSLAQARGEGSGAKR